MTTHENVEDSAGWVRLTWDSSHFGFPIGRLLPSSVSEGDLDIAIRSAEIAGIRCLYWLSDPSDLQADNARRAGFKKVDVRVELGIALGSEPPPQRAATIREAEESDLDALKVLASRSHRNTRFYSDGSFPPEKADALYAAWIERSFRDPNQVVYVSGPAAEPFGYVAFGVSKSGEGEIGLIAVDESHRGSGLGSALVGAALGHLASKGVGEVAVVTQGQNEPARRLYIGMGFTERNRFFWFHRWFGA